MTHWWGSSNFWLGVCRPLRSLRLLLLFRQVFPDCKWGRWKPACWREVSLCSVWKKSRTGVFRGNPGWMGRLHHIFGRWSWVLREWQCTGSIHLLRIIGRKTQCSGTDLQLKLWGSPGICRKHFAQKQPRLWFQISRWLILQAFPCRVFWVYNCCVRSSCTCPSSFCCPNCCWGRRDCRTRWPSSAFHRAPWKKFLSGLKVQNTQQDLKTGCVTAVTWILLVSRPGGRVAKFPNFWELMFISTVY